ADSDRLQGIERHLATTEREGKGVSRREQAEHDPSLREQPRHAHECRPNPLCAGDRAALMLRQAQHEGLEKILTLSLSKGERPNASRRNREPVALLHPLGADALRHQESEFECLAGVKARVARGLIAVVEVDLLQALGATETFGDVLAGHLEMDATGMGALGAM